MRCLAALTLATTLVLGASTASAQRRSTSGTPPSAWRIPGATHIPDSVAEPHYGDLDALELLVPVGMGIAVVGALGMLFAGALDLSGVMQRCVRYCSTPRDITLDLVTGAFAGVLAIGAVLAIVAWAETVNRPTRAAPISIRDGTVAITF